MIFFWVFWKINFSFMKYLRDFSFFLIVYTIIASSFLSVLMRLKHRLLTSVRCLWTTMGTIYMYVYTYLENVNSRCCMLQTVVPQLNLSCITFKVNLKKSFQLNLKPKASCQCHSYLFYIYHFTNLVLLPIITILPFNLFFMCHYFQNLKILTPIITLLKKRA